MKYILLLSLLIVLDTGLFAQSGSTKKQKKVVTIEKKIDKDGHEVIEKKILEDGAIKSMDIEDDDDRIIKSTTDSLGNKVIKNEIRITDEDDKGTVIFGSSGGSYTERTVTIKKNPDGSVEIKDKSGNDFSGRMKIDSAEARKPNLGVSLNDELKITHMIKEGAAEIGGLVQGDVLTHFDGTFINDYDHLKELLHKKKVGDKVILTYLRDRKEIKSTITLKGGTTRVYFNR